MSARDPQLVLDAIKHFNAERDAALLSLDEAVIREFARRWLLIMADEPEAFWRAIHKARTALTTLPMAERSRSKRWLIEHGSEPQDDGDVPL